MDPGIMKDVYEFVEWPYSLRNVLKLTLKTFSQLNMALKRHFLLLLESGKVYLVTSLMSLGKLFQILECRFELFKSKIKKWTPENCPCKLCETYIY